MRVLKRLRLPLGIACGAVGAWLWDGSNTRWLIGLPFNIAFFVLVWISLPKVLSEPEAVETQAVKPAEIPKPKKSPKPKKGAAARSSLPARFLWVWPALIPTAFASALMSQNNFKMGFVFLAIAVACLAALRFFHPEERFSEDRRLEKWMFPLLFLAAVLFRLSLIGSNFSGLQIDEANHLLDALRVLKGEINSPWSVGWWANPSMPYFIIAGWFKVFGANLPSARALSVAEMSLALFFFYRWSRLYFSPAASLTAMGLFTVGWWSLYYSLSPFTDGVTVMFEVIAFYLLETALRKGDRWRWVLFGLAAAASVMTYISGRLIPGMLFLSVLGWWILVRGFSLKGRWRGLLVGALFFAWMIAPFILMVSKNPVDFYGRSKELSIFNEMKRTGDYSFIFRTYGWSTVSFMGVTDGTDPRFNVPNNAMADPVTAGLILIGLVLSLAALRSRATWAALPGFCLAVAANAFAIQGQNPMAGYINGQRFFLITPFYFFLAARGLEWLFHLHTPFSRKAKHVALATFGIGLVVAAGVNFKAYFHDIRDNKDCWESMSIPAPEYAKILAKEAPSYHMICHWEGYLAHLQFLLHDKAKVTILGDDELKVPLRYNVSKNVLLMFPVWRWKQQQEDIKRLYPEAVYDDTPTKLRQAYMVIVKIPQDAVLREMRGRAPEGEPLP